MATLGTMFTRIVDELGGRSELDAQITRAITSAIEFYDEKRFWFNERIGTFMTVDGQEWYSSSDFSPLDNGLNEIDKLTITLNSDDFPLIPRTFDEIECWGNADGDPTDWAFYRNQIRLWPTPNAARTITVAYVAKLGVPDSAASNAWTTEAEELIRTHAKVDLLENVIRGEEEFAEAARLRTRLDVLFNNLQATTRKLTGTGRIVAEYL